jgi:hypothetical protein
MWILSNYNARPEVAMSEPYVNVTKIAFRSRRPITCFPRFMNTKFGGRTESEARLSKRLVKLRKTNEWKVDFDKSSVCKHATVKRIFRMPFSK